jgi:hypothetical protein
MNAPIEPTPQPAPTRGPVRRIAATVIIGGLVFLVLWITAFSVFTSLVIASGCCVAVGAASAVSDVVVTVLDVVASVVLGILAAIAAIFAAIFSIFS